MDIAIIYYSETSNTEQVAEWIADGAKSTGNINVRLFNLRENDQPDKDYISGCDAIIFGTPTYYANMCWQIKKWLDTRGIAYKLAGKLGSAFATENSPYGGGAELAIMTLYNHLLVYGMLVYSSGAEYGRPPIHIGPTVVSSKLEEHRAWCERFGKQIATKAHELFDR